MPSVTRAMWNVQNRRAFPLVAVLLLRFYTFHIGVIVQEKYYPPPRGVGGRQAVEISRRTGRAPEPYSWRRHGGRDCCKARITAGAFFARREGSSRVSKAPPFLSIPRKLKDLLRWGGISLGVRGAAKGGAQNVPAFCLRERGGGWENHPLLQAEKDSNWFVILLLLHPLGESNFMRVQENQVIRSLERLFYAI